MRIPSTRLCGVLLMVLLLPVTGCGDEPGVGPDHPGGVTRVELASDHARIEVGESVQVRAVAYLSDGSSVPEPSIEWRSNDPKVLDIDDAGQATGLAPGFGTIFGTVEGIRGEIEIRVVARDAGDPVASVAVEPDTLELVVGEVRTLDARATNARGSELPERTVEWASSDSAVASVDEEGTVRALSAGASWISATIEGIRDQARVTVVDEPVVRIEIEPNSITLYEGEDLNLHAHGFSASHELLEGREVTWRSDDEDVAQVDATGTLSAVSPGSTFVRATIGDVEASAQVVVLVEPISPTVDRIELAPTNGRLMKSETLELRATVYDTEGNELTDKTIVWSSSDPMAAEVDAEGLVTAVSAGTADIRAEVEGRGAEAEIEVVELRFESISLGGSTACGIATNGRAYCWGTWPSASSESASNSHLPRPLSDSKIFAQISAGGEHVCARTPSGEVWCQGRNGFGALGNGTRTGSDTLVQVQTELSFRHISAGWRYTCGIALDDSAWCWGLNGPGNLGDGTTEDATTPVAVAGGHSFETLSASNAGNVSASTCAVNEAGEAWCWGDGMAGQLGDGQSHHSDVPVHAAPGLHFTHVDIASHWRDGWDSYRGHACGTTASGAAYCWGTNFNGQLGDGSGVDSMTPVQPAGMISFASVVASGSLWDGYSCGAGTNGSIWCWGFNGMGNLGDGTTLVDRMAPVQILSSAHFIDVQMGTYFACGLTDEGTVWCWGMNSVGNLGTPERGNNPVPATVVWQ